MKKLLLGLLIGLGLTAGVAYAANKVQYTPDVYPLTNSQYYLGTTSRAWLEGSFNSLCLTSDSCISSWPTGGGGGAGGGWSTSTPNLITTNWLSATNALVGINTSSPKAVLAVKGISGTTTPTFLVTSSTSAHLFQIASNGSTTVYSLGTGPVYSLSGSLYTQVTTGTGLAVQQTSPTLVTPILGVASGTALTLSNNLWVSGQTALGNASSTALTVSGLSRFASTTITGTLTVSGSTTISSLGSGIVRSTSGGALYIDPATYLTGNQTITLSGDVSGSGETAITTAIGNDKVTEAMLKVVDSPADEDILSYESTTGDFEWHTPAQLNIPNYSYASSAYATFWNVQAGSNITITTSTPGVMTITGAAGGSGNSAWTIGNKVIYNATSTDWVGIGTTTPRASLHVSSSTIPYIILTNSTGSSTSKHLYFANEANGIKIGSFNDAFTSSTTYLYLPNTNRRDTLIGIDAGARKDYNPNTSAYSHIFPDTMIGYKAGTSLVASSTGVGAWAANNAYPYGNTALGSRSLTTATSSAEVTAIGSFALDNATASFNTAVGMDAGRGITSGQSNTAIGNDTMISSNIGASITGNNNTVVGWEAAAGITYGSSFNSFLGTQIAFDQSVLNYMVAAGSSAIEHTFSGSGDIFIGFSAGNDVSTTSYTTAIGYRTLFGNNSNNSRNTALGAYTGEDLTTGSRNILIGYNAGSDLTTASNNIVLGYNLTLPTTTGSGLLNIGNLLYGTSLTNFSSLASSTSAGQIGIGTSTPIAKLTVLASSTDASIPIFVLASSSNSTMFKVSGNGSTTLSSLGTGCVGVSGGSLYTVNCGGGTIDGTGTAGFGARWTDSDSLAAGKLIDDGTSVGINATSSTVDFNIQGTAGTNNSFQVASSTGQPIIKVIPTGHVIIASTTPLTTINGPYSGGTGLSNLIISKEGGSNILTVAAYGTGTVGVSTYHARGTTLSPTATQANDDIYFMGGRGYGSTTWAAGSKVVINMQAAENWTDSAQGTYITFETVENNTTTRSERARVSHEGFLGIGSSTPIALLSVQGRSGSTTPIMIIATSTGSSYLQVTAAGQILTCTTCRLTIPQGTAPTLSAAGDIAIDTSNGGMFSFYANGRENVVATTTKAFFIQSPTASESHKTIPAYSFDVPVTITKVRCLITSDSNTPSWTFSLPHSTSLGTASANAMSSGQACTATTTPQTITIGGDLTLAAGESIWATSSAVTTASSTTIFIDFKYDN